MLSQFGCLNGLNRGADGDCSDNFPTRDGITREAPTSKRERRWWENVVFYKILQVFGIAKEVVGIDIVTTGRQSL